VFSGNLEFAEDGSLYSFFARSSSPLFKSRELAELGTRIRAHPEWGEREVAQAATGAAARFGPDRRAEMETHLDGQLHRIERSLGKTRRGPLVFRTDDRTPRWVIDVFIAHTGGEYTYTAIAEPFEGQLMSLSRASR
jgi:hypothetical protein